MKREDGFSPVECQVHFFRDIDRVLRMLRQKEYKSITGRDRFGDLLRVITPGGDRFRGHPAVKTICNEDAFELKGLFLFPAAITDKNFHDVLPFDLKIEMPFATHQQLNSVRNYTFSLSLLCKYTFSMSYFQPILFYDVGVKSPQFCCLAHC